MDKRFGQLTRDQQLELFTAWLDGRKIEYRNPLCRDPEFNYSETPSWNSKFIYRPMVTKPSINWAHVHPDYRWLSTDGNGETYLFKGDRPEWDSHLKVWTADLESFMITVEAFDSFVPGDCRPEDSLVCRAD